MTILKDLFIRYSALPDNVHTEKSINNVNAKKHRTMKTIMKYSRFSGDSNVG